MGEHLAHGDADFMASGVVLVGSPSAETSAEGAMESDAVGLVGADSEGDISDGTDVLEAVAKGDVIRAVTEITTEGALGVDEEIRAAEVGGGGDAPAVEVASGAVGGLLDVAHFDVVAEEAGRTGSRESGGRTKGEETEDR
jgi:hypothetical protein